MNCSNCGYYNNTESKFCVKCGQSLALSVDVNSLGAASNVQMPINNVGVVDKQVNIQPQSPEVLSVSNNSKVEIMDLFKLVFSFITKPFTATQEKMGMISEIKNSVLITVIVSLIATLINLVKSMISAVVVKDFDWYAGTYKTTVQMANLGKLNYLQLIGKTLIIIIASIAFIAAVYYIVSLIIKKQPSFAKILGISALCVTPVLGAVLLFAPILSLIWSLLYMPVVIIGFVYTFILMYEGTNNEIALDGNVKYYFNLICLSIILIALYYLYTKMFVGSITGISDVMNLLG